MGCKSFAILFDDINASLSEADIQNFESPGHAQSTLANILYEKLMPTKHFMFCPTGEKKMLNVCFLNNNSL